MSSYRPLHEAWTLSGSSYADVPATVPGCVHTDLLAAGLIEDPYVDDAETRLGWIGRTDWEYRCTFDWEPDGHHRVDLVCAGLDTVATVLVNGTEVGGTANMHRSYRFAVEGLLRPGANTVAIRFRSAYDYIEERRAVLGDRPGSYPEPYQFIRKMACNFGWDWGPTLVTAGIWRPIGLHSWSGARLAEVRPLVTVADGNGRVEVRARIDRAGGGPRTVTATVAGVRTAVVVPDGETAVRLVLDVPEVELWWPRGHGEPACYPMTVRVYDDVWTREIGFRSVELDRDAFRIAINGKPIFVKGFNWIPDDCFPHRVAGNRLAERFDQAVGAGANLVRVWGGGLYESDEFYDAADRLGLLVWQDFPFACAAYPEEEPFRSEVAAEATENVTRLSTHPSLVLWCGNNENLEGHADWGWQPELAGRSWGSGFYHELLPRIVDELDPTRPYIPGSPFSPDPAAPVQDQSSGTVHIWSVWGSEDYTHYASYTPRFVSEFGFQGPAAYATLRRSVTDETLTPDSAHQKAVGGNAKLLRGLGDHLPRPETFDDWHYLTQLNQARAVAFGIEHFRALAPYCMGAVVWQLNDCWPVTSWAAVDGDGRRKPLWYAVRRAFADRLLTFAGGRLTAINDTDQVWSGELTVVRRGLTGEPLAKESFPIQADPRGSARLDLPAALTAPGRVAHEMLVADLDGARALRFFAEDPAIAFPPADFDAVVETVPGGFDVRITAHTVVRELAVFPDRLDPAATVDDQLVTLLPGETASFHVTTEQDLRATALTSYPVLRCVNERSEVARSTTVE